MSLVTRLVVARLVVARLVAGAGGRLVNRREHALEGELQLIRRNALGFVGRRWSRGACLAQSFEVRALKVDHLEQLAKLRADLRELVAQALAALAGGSRHLTIDSDDELKNKGRTTKEWDEDQRVDRLARRASRSILASTPSSSNASSRSLTETRVAPLGIAVGMR